MKHFWTSKSDHKNIAVIFRTVDGHKIEEFLTISVKDSLADAVVISVIAHAICVRLEHSLESAL